MNKIRYSEQDGVLQAFVIPIYIGAHNTILLGGSYWQNWRVFLFGTVVAFVAAYGSWILDNLWGLYLNRRFPNVNHTALRVGLLLVGSLVVGVLAVGFMAGVYVGVDINPVRIGWALAFEWLMILLVTAIYEGIRTFERWELTLRETEQLKKANLQSQFEGLKSQINPHFLFNSLNTLSSLIEEDSAQAEEFVEEMASVYRYLLRNNENQLATLSAELAFVQSYFHLLRTRYGANIHLEQAVDQRLYDHLLPPLTLQLLLENAVKHNVILPEQPLVIQIQTDNEAHLIVRNNLQRKNTRVMSNQIGLANIATQYRLMGGGNMHVSDDDGFFTVTLPLIRQL